MTQPAAAPAFPWPAMWPATPPTIAPLMHPFAWTALENARPSRAVQMIRLFMTVFSGIACGSIPAGNGLFPTNLYDHGTYCLWSGLRLKGPPVLGSVSPPNLESLSGVDRRYRTATGQDA